MRGESILAEIQLEQATHLGFVFNNQNRRHPSSVLLLRFTKSLDEHWLPLHLSRLQREKTSQNTCRFRSSLHYSSFRPESIHDAHPQSSTQSTNPIPLQSSSSSQTD